MLILSRVCAEFHDKSGARIFTVTPRTRLTFQEAPEAIRDDPLFEMLRRDRSIEVADHGPCRKQLENDPESPAEPESAAVEPEPAAGNNRASARKGGGKTAP